MSLEALRVALRAHGGTVAELVRETDRVGANGAGRPDGGDPDGAPGVGAPQLAARGPRAAGDPAQYELLLEMILEGSLLHYGHPRVVITEDRDLALLLGDQLYALGLARLADLGDLDSVSELADIISLLSQAELVADAPLAHAVWEAGATAIGWGASPDHESAKALARAGDAAAVPALLQSASRRETAPPSAPIGVPGTRAG